MKKIIWLASYPKSGNTWTRSFLTYLLRKDIRENDDDIINGLIAPILSARSRIEEYLLLETSELTHHELEAYIPLALRELAKDIDHTPFFIKAHDAYTFTEKGEPLYPSDISIGAIYLVRNVLDVIVSFAHHNNGTVKNTIQIVKQEDFAFLARTNDIRSQTRQKLLSWDGHYLSWKNQQEIPTLFIRYEDMVLDTFNTFKKMVRFSGLEATDNDIQAAIEQASFANLKAQEEKHGFGEKKSDTKSFFRKGKIGSWRESISEAEAQIIINDHRVVMEELGYIDATGNPVH